MQNISIGSDHAGFELKEKVKKYISSIDYNIIDEGTYSLDSCDYPDYAHPVANAVSKSESTFGILICGSANGVCMTANKYQEVRAALCWTPEIAELARLHNNANVLCLPARYLEEEMALDIVKVFLSTDFEGGRHERRVNKISIPIVD